MEKPKGYCGRILHVDLSREKITVEKPPATFYRTYLGGSCLGSYYLFKEMEQGVDALDPRNVLVFSVSPVTGAKISGTSRFNITAKSPLTDTIGDSQGGGYWGKELKYAGFDAIVIKGKADNPVYLWVHDGECELKTASHIWGKDTGKAQRIIREELGDSGIRVALIGPAGEKLVRYACVTNELKHFNGRNGMGAVMGAKNLKAIAVKGSQKPLFHDENKIKELARYGGELIKENPVMMGLRDHGTAQVVTGNQALGGLPTRNWLSGSFINADKISGVEMSNTILKKRESCWGCIVNCKRVVQAEKPHVVDPAYGGPEYESIASLGSYLAIDDLIAIAKANELCNKYTIDTISLGGTVAFAMECFEKGLIDKKDTGGIDLKFGNADALLNIIEMIKDREGIGDILAEGSARAAEKIGPQSHQIAMHVKKQELPAHMPRVKASLALAYACNPFGADHMSSEHDTSIMNEPFLESMTNLGFDKTAEINELNFEKAKLFAYSQRAYSLLDTLDLCMFCFGFWTLYKMNHVVELLNAATGWNTNLCELMRIGERRMILMRSFNAREGLNELDDLLPERLHEPLIGGSTEGQAIDKSLFYETRKNYYELAGLNPKNGHPTVSKLMELGLDWVIG